MLLGKFDITFRRFETNVARPKWLSALRRDFGAPPWYSIGGIRTNVRADSFTCYSEGTCISASTLRQAVCALIRNRQSVDGGRDENNV